MRWWYYECPGSRWLPQSWQWWWSGACELVTCVIGREGSEGREGREGREGGREGGREKRSVQGERVTLYLCIYIPSSIARVNFRTVRANLIPQPFFIFHILNRPLISH